jgi:hypothetical protein
MNAGSLNVARFPILDKIQEFKKDWKSQYLEKDIMAKSSAEQVEKIIRIGKEHGLEPVTPNEVREILNLKGQDKVKF